MTALLYLADGRMAIEHNGVRLAVPHIPRGVSRRTRQQVFEYVLRRQPAMAQLIAIGELDDVKRETFDDIKTLLRHDWQTNDGEAA